jgi:hypothetical protein
VVIKPGLKAAVHLLTPMLMILRGIKDFVKSVIHVLVSHGIYFRKGKSKHIDRTSWPDEWYPGFTVADLQVLSRGIETFQLSGCPLAMTRSIRRTQNQLHRTSVDGNDTGEESQPEIPPQGDKITYLYGKALQEQQDLTDLCLPKVG